MKDAIAHYHSCFDNERQKAIDYIKKTLVMDKKNHYPFLRSHNELINEFVEIQKNTIPQQIPYVELYTIFKNRCSYFDVDHQYQILTKEIEPEFLKINKDITFEEFISDLAKYEAYHEVINLFCNNSQIYRMMYEINKFEGWTNMVKFDIINYHHQPEGTKIYKELRETLNPLEKVDKAISESKDLTSHNNYFGLKKEYSESFLSEANYASLTDVFIDEQKTTHQDFVEVFTKNPETNNSKIYFFCDTQLCSLLLHKLQKNIFTGLNQNKIGNSNKFYSNNNNSLKQANISNSKKTASSDELLIVENYLSALKDGKIS